jgi:hypothetical protein
MDENLSKGTPRLPRPGRRQSGISSASRANWLVLHLFIVYRNLESDLVSGTVEEAPFFLEVGDECLRRIPLPIQLIRGVRPYQGLMRGFRLCGFNFRRRL